MHPSIATNALTFDDFQREIESASGFLDWKYVSIGDHGAYFTAYRNNQEFTIQYAPSEYRYDWQGTYTFSTRKVTQDCFSLQDVIDFLDMRKYSLADEIDDRTVESCDTHDFRKVWRNIGILFIGASIGWAAAFVVTPPQLNLHHQSELSGAIIR